MVKSPGNKQKEQVGIDGPSKPSVKPKESATPKESDKEVCTPHLEGSKKQSISSGHKCGKKY